jgi:NCK adaptor protein
VVLKAPDRNKHFRVQVNEGLYHIGAQKFISMDDLIEHYKKHPIYKSDTEKLYLIKAFTYPSDF